TNNKFTEHVKQGISRGKRKLFSLFGLGHKSGGLPPLLAIKLYNSFVIPTMLYGDQIINYNTQDLEMMEVTQREIGRRVQFFPSTASNPTSIMPVGLTTIKSRIDYDKLLMFFGILTLPMTNIYKQLLMMRLTSFFFQGDSWDS
ncbi:unnamed protein product, partial [Owenia fusiformis]